MVFYYPRAGSKSGHLLDLLDAHSINITSGSGQYHINTEQPDLGDLHLETIWYGECYYGLTINLCLCCKHWRNFYSTVDNHIPYSITINFCLCFKHWRNFYSTVDNHIPYSITINFCLCFKHWHNFCFTAYNDIHCTHKQRRTNEFHDSPEWRRISWNCCRECCCWRAFCPLRGVFLSEAEERPPRGVLAAPS